MTRHITKTTTPPIIPPTIGATFDTFREVGNSVLAAGPIVEEPADEILDDGDVIVDVIVSLTSSSVVYL